MKPQLRWLLLLPLLVAAPLFGQTLNFNLNSAAGSLVAFNGTDDTLSFSTGSSGFDFGISNSGGSMLSLNTLSGNLSGQFSVGTISPAGPNMARAPVSGQGLFSIADGQGQSISATLTLGDAFVYRPADSFGSLNSLGTVNLVNFSGYSGTDTRLAQLAGRSAVFNLSFHFDNPGPSLSQIFAPGANSATTFNGSVTLVAIPEPSSVALGLALAAFALVVLRHRPDRLAA